MAWKHISFIMDYWVYISLVHIITLDSSSCKILSITRSSDTGDSFEVPFENKNESVCQMSSCEQFGGFLHKSNQGHSHDKCSCYCGNSTKPTFYSTKTGEQSCVNDLDVLEDTNGNICDFYTDKAQHLEVLNLHGSGKARMKPDDFCEHVQVSEWKFYFNTSWISATFDTFSTITVGNNGSGKTKKLQTLLTWNGNLGPFYKGLLIKVMIHCTYRGITDDRCVMLKAQGTHVYHKVPTNSPTMPQSPNSPPIKEPASSTVIPKQKNWSGQTKSEALPESRDSTPLPTADLSKASTRQIWLTVALGLSAVVLIAIIVITGFLVVKCRRNCRKRQRTGSRNHLQVPVPVQPRSEENPAMHDYEYVHYPCLVDGGRTPPATPIGNRKYERGQDNKLIIWTPGRSPLPTQNNQSTGATAPRLPYQRLLTRTSSSSPDGTVSIQPVGSPAAGEGFPYQKLIRTVSSMERSEQKGCCQAAESTADAQPLDEALQKPYQSLSLSRNPLASPKESDTGYMRMEGVPRPDSTYEYDYSEPLELNKLFRISHGETDRGPMEISIGDLRESASNQQQQRQQQRSDEVRLSVISSDENYEDVGNTDVRKQQEQQHYDEVRISMISSDENYEYVENIDVRNSLPSAVKNDYGLELKGVKAASNEDLSGDTLGRLSGGRSDLEEYIEMGKRRSMLIEESPDQSGCHGFAKIEEEGPEYFVLEDLEKRDGKADEDS